MGWSVNLFSGWHLPISLNPKYGLDVASSIIYLNVADINPIPNNRLSSLEIPALIGVIEFLEKNSISSFCSKSTFKSLLDLK